jgi:hypothetical protein
MHRFATTFARTLALFTLTSLVGCDDIEDVDIDELEDVDIELRTGGAGGPTMAGIPWDHHDAQMVFGVPMQVSTTYKPKLTYALHMATNVDYDWTLDPTGAPDTLVADAEGDHPYSGDVPKVDESVCEDFLALHPYYVPVTHSLSICAAIELGCCDFICYQWGGYPVEQNGQNEVGAVSNETFELAQSLGKEMIWGTYVENDPINPRMTWNKLLDNGGYGERQNVCQCECAFELGFITP